nr:protein ACCELERATED CELL DEATH 6-like [Ipomoea batatas]
MKREIYLCDMTDDSGWTPLHYAIKNQYSETARMLLAERSCSAYICVGKGNKWTTAFHIAASLNAIDYILKYPQIDNLIAGKDKDGKTPVAFLLSSCRDLGTILWNMLLCRAKFANIPNLKKAEISETVTPLRTHAGLLTGEIRARGLAEWRGAAQQGQSDRSFNRGSRNSMSPERRREAEEGQSSPVLR